METETQMQIDTGGMSEEGRERALRSLAGWLDRALEDEQAPEGLTPELASALENGDPLPPLESEDWPADLYSLWAAMTALSQQMQMQGRQFKQLIGLLTEEREAAREPDPVVMAPAGPRRQEVDLLLDLVDRVERGIATLRRASGELAPSRLPAAARWMGATAYARRVGQMHEAILQGHVLMQDRLNESLVACGIDRLVSLNRPFDPERMTAIDIADTADVPEGTVVEVYREGYEWEGRIYRTAQVKVARRMRNV